MGLLEEASCGPAAGFQVGQKKERLHEDAFGAASRIHRGEL